MRCRDILLIFDCDGVLVDSERILNQVDRECLCAIGLESTKRPIVESAMGYFTT